MQIKDIFSRLYKIIFDIFFYTAIIVVIIGLLPDQNFKDFQINPNRHENEHLFKGLGSLEWNNHLVSKAKVIGENKLVGPESLVDIGDFLYTGLADGRLVRVNKLTEQIEEVTRFSDSKTCGEGDISKLKTCGRPLGLRYHSDNYLYVLEANTGLFRVDLEKKTKILLTKQPSDNQLIYNDLVFDPEQKDLVYISVSSHKWQLDRIAYSIIEHDKTGSVLAFDLKTNKMQNISVGHPLANGIEITADQKFLLVSETNSYSIKKMDLSKAREAFKTSQVLKSEELELFGKLLPGEPDNIRLEPNTGDILVGMFTTRPNGKLLRDYLSNWPFVRKALARTAYVLSNLLDYVHKNLYPSHDIQQISFDLYSGHIIYKALPQKDGAVVKLDGKTGQIKQILGSSKFNAISEAIVDKNGDLYFGSFRNKFIGFIPKGSH